MAIAAISLGSNLGNTKENLQQGISRLRDTGITITKESDIITTEPEGFRSDKKFLNQCILIETEMSPEALLQILLKIEQQAGRTRIPGILQDRPLDLDLLFYGKRIINNKELVLPHPRMHQRLFVLYPLLEIAPEWRHPVLKKSITELIAMKHLQTATKK
jgi:2-amino-4-hydroxy-6-hydroxymethyldihydropteridine diphosphokinase